MATKLDKLKAGRQPPRKPSAIIAPAAAGMSGNVLSPGTSTGTPALAFLDWTHPIFDANRARWLENETRIIGGDLVADELRPFEWEKGDMTSEGSSYQWRQKLAVYPNLPDKLATLISGHLMRSAPRPDQGLDFGSLGKVGAIRDKEPTRAEMIYYSCDQPGACGDAWDPWWEHRLKLAMATGHRWIFVNGAPTQPANREQERYGMRPYLVEWSPLQVPAWYYNRHGQLEFLIARVDDLDPRVEGQVVKTKRLGNEQGYLLLVRKGTTRLGTELPFADGGWWLFDSEKKQVDQGDLDDCYGEIPAFPMFYERSKGIPGHPKMSREATTELGNCAIALMNLTSAANFDAWDAAKGIEWLRGVDIEAWDLAKRQIELGSRRIPLPPNSETDHVPEVTDSGAGAMQADIFTAREASLWKQAQWLGIAEVASDGSTAAGSNADFSATQMPRIVRVALNLQAAQNMAIYYLEMRFGQLRPTGQASWPTKFNLVELADRVKSFFEAERLSGLRCAPLDAEAMVQLAVEKGLVTNEADKQKFKAAYEQFGELRDSMLAADAQTALGQPPQDPNGAALKQATRISSKKTGTPPGRPAPTE
jgi:hypothetical protein